jgi:hypothetical protein
VASVLPAVPTADSLGVSARFYGEFYASLHAREDALCELTDAMLCAQGPARTLVELSLAAEHRPRRDVRRSTKATSDPSGYAARSAAPTYAPTKR